MAMEEVVRTILYKVREFTGAWEYMKSGYQANLPHDEFGDVVHKMDCEVGKLWKGILSSIVEPCLYPELVTEAIFLGAEFKSVRFSGNSSILHKVVESPNFDVSFLEFLLNRGASIDACDWRDETPLELNLSLFGDRHHCSATSVFLKRMSNRKINAVHRCGDTLLTKAAGGGCPNCVRALVERGADVNKALSYSKLPVTVFLNNVSMDRVPSGVDTFRLLLRKTDKTKLLKLRYTELTENPCTEFDPLANPMSKPSFEYFDVIWEEEYQLLDFVCADVLRFTDEDFSFFEECNSSFYSMPEPYLTEIVESFLHLGALSDTRIYERLCLGMIKSKFFLVLVHRGLNTPARLFDLDQLLWDSCWILDVEDFLDTVVLLGALGVADTRFLRAARDEIEKQEDEEFFPLNENRRQKCSLLGTEVRSLKRTCTTVIRERLFQCHGHVGLVPLILELNLPDAIGDLILCRDVHI